MLAFPGIQFAYSGQISSAAQFSAIGGGNPDLAIENTFQYADNLSVTRGNHTFKVGADFRRYRFDAINGGGTLIFGSIFSSSSDTPGSGAPLADFLLGYPSNTDGKQLLDWSRQRDLYAGFFFQDDWKVSRRLTLNVGVRYDLFTQPVDDRDRGGLFDLRTGKNVIPGKDGFSRAIVNADHNNIAPRLGFAYSATSKLTIRSGGGHLLRKKRTESGCDADRREHSEFAHGPLPGDQRERHGDAPGNYQFPDRPGCKRSQFHGHYRGESGQLQYPRAGLPERSDALCGAMEFQLAVRAPAGPDDGGFLLRHKRHKTDRAGELKPDPTGGCSRGPDHAGGPARILTSTIQLVSMPRSQTTFTMRMNVRLEKRFRGGFAFMANYTWSKNLESNGNGDSSFNQNGGTTLPIDSYNLSRERSYAPLDVPHVFNLNYAYELPFGASKRWLNQKGPVNWVLGGWQFNGILSKRSGFPTDIRSSPHCCGEPDVCHAERAGSRQRRFHVSAERVCRRLFQSRRIC